MKQNYKSVKHKMLIKLVKIPLRLLRDKLNGFLQKFGYKIAKVNPADFPEFSVNTLCKSMNIDCVIDIGANTGQFALTLRQYGYKGAIYSIEPMSAAHEILTKTSLKDYKWTIIERCAVGDENKTALINISNNSVSSSLREITQKHLDAAPKSNFVSAEEVEVIRLDEIFKSYSLSKYNKRLLKIDTQGFEREVLLGSLRVLDLIDLIAIEISLVEVYRGQALFKELDNFLMEAGFNLHTIHPGLMDVNTAQTLQIDAIYSRKGNS